MFSKMEILVLDIIIGCYTQLSTNSLSIGYLGICILSWFNLGKYNTPNNAYFNTKVGNITNLMLSGDYVVINKLIKSVWKKT